MQCAICDVIDIYIRGINLRNNIEPMTSDKYFLFAFSLVYQLMNCFAGIILDFKSKFICAK